MKEIIEILRQQLILCGRILEISQKQQQNPSQRPGQQGGQQGGQSQQNQRRD